MQTPRFQQLSFPWMGIVPPIVASVAVGMEHWLTDWSKGRTALLPLGTMLVLAVLVHPRLRHLLMITLCYGVSFLALRDIVRLAQVPLPPPFNYENWEIVRTLGLLLVAGLSGTAAVAETLRPGTVWARRCYFGAAALYFIGLGVINFLWHHSSQSVLLMLTGVPAALGCVFSHRIVATELEETDEEILPSDEALQQAREAAHRAALQAKEWRDNLVTGIEERDTPSTGPA